jgi:hypothetical protein
VSDLIPLVATVAFFITSMVMLKMFLGHREKVKSMSPTKMGSGASDERLARMEQAVEAIAIEIERVSEGQRFVTKLLSERARPMIEETAVPQAVRRANTPH